MSAPGRIVPALAVGLGLGVIAGQLLRVPTVGPVMMWVILLFLIGLFMDIPLLSDLTGMVVELVWSAVSWLGHSIAGTKAGPPTTAERLALAAGFLATFAGSWYWLWRDAR